MSVLHDVLKNLDAQKSQASSYPFSYHNHMPARIPNIVWVMLAAMALVILTLSVQLYSVKQSQLSVPYGLYDAEPEQQGLSTYELNRSDKHYGDSKAATVSPNTNINTASTSSQKNISQNASSTINNPAERSVVSHNNAAVKKPDVVQKSSVIKAQEQAIEAFKKGDTAQVKASIAQAEPAFKERVQLRVMLKENPQAILPYLQKNVPYYQSDDELLALAAQAQQRIGEHKQAIFFYNQLIQRNPQEPRWLAGLAISLDGLGEHAQASSLYKNLLSRTNLPAPLHDFIAARVKRMEIAHE